MNVFIIQCLCPQRHCVIGLASETETEAEALAAYQALMRERLKDIAATLIKSKEMNPWCALCGARSEQWHYEVGATAFTSMEAARTAIRETEQAQRQTAERLRALGLAFDSPRKNGH